MSNQHWYAVYTRPRAEDQARRHLERQNFAVYLPVFTRTIRHARKVSQVSAALFPRYLFVRLDLAADAWRPVLSTSGVAGMVMQGDAPVPVPETVIAAIRAREGEDGKVTLPARPAIAIGTKVTIEGGPFQDSIGLFEGQADDERVMVLLSLLGRNVRVTLPMATIHPLP